MSELVNRLIARTDSDIKRGINFAVGMRHFTELVYSALLEMDLKVKRMEEIAAKLEGKQ